jgi:hypothetical protein
MWGLILAVTCLSVGLFLAILWQFRCQLSCLFQSWIQQSVVSSVSEGAASSALPSEQVSHAAPSETRVVSERGVSGTYERSMTSTRGAMYVGAIDQCINMLMTVRHLVTKDENVNIPLTLRYTDSANRSQELIVDLDPLPPRKSRRRRRGLKCD